MTASTSGPDSDLRKRVASQANYTGTWTSIEGATTAQLWKFETAEQTVVIKAFTNPSFVAEYPDCVEHATSAMAHVQANSELAVPTVVGRIRAEVSPGVRY